MGRTLKGLLATTLAFAVLVGLGACVLFPSSREPMETALPAALVVSDVGITSAEAERGTEGLSSEVTVVAKFDHHEISADELIEMLKLIVDIADAADIVEIIAIDDRAPASGESGYSFDEYYLDLASLGDELGLTQNGPELLTFRALWSDVVAFLEKTLK